MHASLPQPAPRIRQAFADIVRFTNLHTRRSPPLAGIVFDQYLTCSLKETTLKKRTIKTAPVHYHANDNINKRHALPKHANYS